MLTHTKFWNIYTHINLPVCLMKDFRYWHSVPKAWTSLFYRQPPFPPFSESPSLLARLFWQCRPTEIPDKHKNKLMWKGYFFIFKRLKNNITCFFYKQHFYKQHLVEIQTKIVTIPSIKRSQKKNEHSKWKACWVKSITPIESILYLRKAVLTRSFPLPFYG